MSPPVTHASDRFYIADYLNVSLGNSVYHTANVLLIPTSISKKGRLSEPWLVRQLRLRWLRKVRSGVIP